MRKLLSFTVALLLSISMYAQSTNDINRLLIHESNGTSKGFVIDKVDSLTFAKVEGEVAANVEILEHDLEKVILNVTRTASCVGFKIALEASVIVAQISEDNLAQYIDRQASSAYYQDFSAAELTGEILSPDTEYTIMTVGIDEYGVLCDVKKAEFKTEGATIVGEPYVTAETVEVNLYDFTVSFTPNEDVASYHVVAGEKGSLQQQYEQFAPMFGFANIGDMIIGWGIERTGTSQHQWTDMAPNTDYEIYIQAIDHSGNKAPHQVYELRTLSNGGEGTAEVAITIGDYVLADWYGDMLPSQFITFTPNDQTSAYRISVVLKEYYDQDQEGYKQDLCSENTMNMAGWFQYEELTTDFQIDPNLDVVALAAGKNANGEWGPITEVFFTTPAEAATRSNTGTITARKSNNTKNTAGKIPTFKQKGQLKLTNK